MITDMHPDSITLMKFLDYALTYPADEETQNHLHNCLDCRRVVEEHLVMIAAHRAKRHTKTMSDFDLLDPRTHKTKLLPEVPLFRHADRLLRAYGVLNTYDENSQWERWHTYASVRQWTRRAIEISNDDERISQLEMPSQILLEFTLPLYSIVKRASHDDIRFRAYPLRSLSWSLLLDERTVAKEFMAAYVAADLIHRAIGSKMDHKLFSPILRDIEALENTM